MWCSFENVNVLCLLLGFTYNHSYNQCWCAYFAIKILFFYSDILYFNHRQSKSIQIIFDPYLNCKYCHLNRKIYWNRNVISRINKGEMFWSILLMYKNLLDCDNFLFEENKKFMNACVFIKFYINCILDWKNWIIVIFIL